MTGSFTDTLETNILNWLRGTPMPSAPAALYLAAFTVAPSDAGGGTEVSGGSYARQGVSFGAPSGGQMTNTAQVKYPDASADWGTIVAVAVMDAASGGNMLAWATLATAKVISTGARLVVDAGSLTISVD